MTTEFSQLARNDLIDIWNFIAEDNLDAADHLRQRFEEVIRLIGQNPEAGTRRDDLAKGVRTYPVGVYLIIYRVKTKQIHIVRILHGMRDIKSHLQGN